MPAFNPIAGLSERFKPGLVIGMPSEVHLASFEDTLIDQVLPLPTGATKPLLMEHVTNGRSNWERRNWLIREVTPNDYYGMARDITVEAIADPLEAFMITPDASKVNRDTVEGNVVGFMLRATLGSTATKDGLVGNVAIPVFIRTLSTHSIRVMGKMWRRSYGEDTGTNNFDEVRRLSIERAKMAAGTTSSGSTKSQYRTLDDGAHSHHG